jgi:hypothetical protein
MEFIAGKEMGDARKAATVDSLLQDERCWITLI